MTRRALLLWTTGVVLFTTVVFALPLVATGVLLTCTMLLSPAVWCCGASYTRDGLQPFFRGGLICGILPFVIASVISVVFAMQLAASGEIHGFSLFVPIYSADPVRRAATLETAASSTAADVFYAELPQRLKLAVLWLAPGVVAVLGGALSYLTYRLVTPKQESTPAAPPPLDYRVLSSRLTTQEAEIPR
jgi:hypothetical protein